MNKTIIAVLCITLLGGCSTKGNPPADMDKQEQTVLTSLEATTLLARTLLQNTPVKVVQVTPRNYSMTGHERYYKKSREKLRQSAQEAQAVISLRSAWKGDVLYPHARRGNIRIIEIDATAPKDMRRPGLPLIRNSKGEVLPRVWLSPSNMGRMADIAARDLCAVYPQHQKQIESNLRSLSRALFKLRSKYEMKLLMFDSTSSVKLTDLFDYLISEFGLEITGRFLKPEHRWTDQDLREFKTILQKHRPKIAICRWIPDESILSSLKEADSVPVVLKTFSKAKADNSPQNKIVEIYEYNLEAICEALAEGQNQ